MIISGVNFNKNYSQPKKETNIGLPNQKPQYKNLQFDCFQKQSNNINNIKGSISPVNIKFTGDITYISNDFETKFPRTFFKKLAAEHLPCAYTGIEMISRAEYDRLKEMHVLQKRGPVAIKFLKKYKNSMIGVEKEIFSYLESESKKHPDLKLQELLQLKYASAEKTLIRQQSLILDKINLVGRKLQRNEYLELRKLINSSFDKIFEPNPQPEDRFRKKDFQIQLENLDIKDQKLKTKLLKIAKALPTSSSSVNAFIVKYSQPYKVKYADGELIKTVRDSEELGLRLISPVLATDEHIHAHKLYRQEEQELLKNIKNNKNLKTFKVTILTTAFINNKKGDTSLDEFIKNSAYNIPQNVQIHINKLTKTAYVWMKKGNLEDAATLVDYIHVLKNEFSKRSKLITVDTSELEKIEPEIIQAYQKHTDKMQLKKMKKAKKEPTKSSKRPDNADNSHSEVYTTADGRRMENRKKQRHKSRFGN